MSLGTDLKRYSRGLLPRLALATIILMPLLYGAMYLWAFWNPFGEVDKLPVALVNEDPGTQTQGRQIDAGDQVARSLLDSGQLDLHEMSAAAAADGVRHGDYYFAITIPEDFSAAVASPAGPDPRPAKIRFTFDNSNNYLASIIGQNAAREVLNQVNARVGQQTVGQVLSGVTDAGAGLVTAADGADRLSAGLVQADDGARELAGGTRALSAGLQKARDGSAALAAGASQLSEGVGAATDPLLSVLDRVSGLGLDPAEVGDLASGLSRLVKSTSDRVAALNVDQAQAAAVVDTVVGALRANPDPAVQALGDTLAGTQRLLRANGVDPTTDEGLITLRDKAAALEAELADPSSKLRMFLTKALDGRLRADVARLRDGAAQLSTGATQLNRGLVALADGGEQLSSGASALADGTHQLRSGSAELAHGLREGAERVPQWSAQQRNQGFGYP
ncbi:hypothetical protein A5633_09895, partial [Mycolicibacterium elephantis]